MHDFLLENSLMYKELVKEGEIKGFEKGEQKGLEKGHAQGMEEGLRQSIEAVVKVRFPDLVDFARERVVRIHDEQMLRNIHLQLIILATEGEAHRFLTGLPDEHK